MMTSFCNKKVHPFICLPNSKHNGTEIDFSLPRPDIFTAASIGGDTPMTPPAAVEKKDPGGFGFLDEVGGTVDGLMSCTETLGFESSDERSVDDQIEDNHHEIDLFPTRNSYYGTNNMASTNNSRSSQRGNLEKKEKTKKFPPPLSSLSQDGKPNFFLRAVRKDGRLELTEVKIGWQKTLLASRQDGRLRLHLIPNEKEEEEEEENEDFPVETEKHLNDEEIETVEENEHLDDDGVIETIEENDDEIIDDDDEEEKVEEWKFPMTSSASGDAHRRCYGGHHGHRHNNLHVWRQRCVTTR
ncbi:transcription initiation factor TFIID subunit 7-like [Lycium barbarum]|uniref:transcription initiation factor TFIID subunit 7-like n=1 Tax=Lycium barbarum TaxID=112863 RepID=UPI00293F76F7|nr:transcription initiation factor TFIID subunit 7-like [Lycium barbarum]